ncbi:MAG: TetR/AcrR family transcriptional regulator [Clostridia bacterium]|nr:TetR/AcrR family transcriptional regulator [Clostridia bacterium]
MTKFTKKAIKDAFMKLLDEKPFEAITVKDIAAECGINRNTFYYNYKDIYALTDDILQEEIRAVAKEYGREYISWNEALMYAAGDVLRKRKAIYHLHNSPESGQIRKCLEKVLYGVVFDFVKTEAREVDISEEDTDFVVRFYVYALVGLLDDWLDRGMTDDFAPAVEKASVMFESNIKQAVEMFGKK